MVRRGQKRRSRPDESDDASAHEDATPKPTGSADGDEMDVDQAAIAAETDSEGSGGEDDQDEGTSVADRVRRRRVRPANLVASEGDLRAVASSNFAPPLEGHSRPFVVYEVLSDVKKGVGRYEVKIYRESQSQREWTAVTSGKGRAVVAEDWQTCSLAAQCVGTRKIRITVAEEQRVMQCLILQEQSDSDHDSESDESDNGQEPRTFQTAESASDEEEESEKVGGKRAQPGKAKQGKKATPSPKKAKQQRTTTCPPGEKTDSDEDKPLQSPAAKRRRKGYAKVGESAKKTTGKAKAGMVGPRPDVHCIDCDPTFRSTTEPVAGGKDLKAKDVIRAILIKDNKLLQKLVNDRQHIHTLLMTRSAGVGKNAINYAIEDNNVEALAILAKYFNTDHRTPRCAAPNVALAMMDSGSVGRATYRHGVGAVGAARGGRELQNAMLSDTKQNFYNNVDCYALGQALMSSRKVTPATLDRVMTLFGVDLMSNVCYAARCGNRRAAAHVLKQCKQPGNEGFNFLHVQAASLNGEDFDKFTRISVNKKPYGNRSLRPAHLAAINPHPKYLKALMDVVADYSIADDDRWCPIHYAATCEGPGPLEYLISRGVDLLAPTKQGEIPLMLAARTGRKQNIALLLGVDKDVVAAMITKKDSAGNTALHHAVLSGEGDIIPLLVEAGVPTDACNVAGRRMDVEQLNLSNLTPMGLAASLGHLECVRRLHGCGVSIAKADRRKRTPLMMACRDGQLHIVCYLLHHGVDACAADSSGNTAVHYAAAYGWLRVLKLLVQCGANADAVSTWKGTPLSCASLKNQAECTDYLVSLGTVNLNVRDSSGRTIIANLARTPTADGLQQLRFLIKSNAGVDITDVAGRTALHHVCVYTTREGEDSFDLIADFVGTLLGAGADINLKDNEGLTPLMCAVSQVNLAAAESLLSQGAALDGEDRLGRNILHMLAEHLTKEKASTLLKKIAKVDGSAAIVNKLDSGKLRKTPLLVAVSSIQSQLSSSNCHGVWYSMSKEKSAARLQRVVNTLKLFLELDGLDVNVPVKQKDGDDTMKMAVDGESDLPEEEASVEDEDEDGDNTDSDNSDFLSPAGSGKLSGSPLKPNVPQEVGWTCVHFLASNNEMYKPVFVKALQRGGNVNAAAVNGETPLHVAIRGNIEWAARELVTAGAHADRADNTGSTALHLACQSCPDATYIEELIGLGSVSACDKHQRTALHYATRASNVKLCKLLLGKGANPNSPDKLGRTPLHFAVSGSARTADASSDLERVLIAHKADVNIQDNLGRCPLHYAFVRVCLVDEVPEKSSAGNDLTKLEADTLLAENAVRERIDPIETVSSLCAIEGIMPDLADKTGRSPLHYAAKVSALTSSLYLLSRGAMLNREDGEENTPLALALLASNPDYSVMIMQKGADVLKRIHTVQTKKDDGGKKAPHSVSTFFHAVQQGWLGVSYMILDNGFPPFEAIRDAMATGKYQLTLTLMGKLKDDVLSSRDADCRSLLHWLCRSAAPELPENASTILEMLVRSGCSPHDTDKSGMTPLHNAAKQCAVRLAKDLLSVYKCDVNKQDVNGSTPLMLALMGPFSSAKLHSSEEAVSHILGRSCVRDFTHDRPPSESTLGMVDLLLKNGANPTGQYDDPAYDDGLTTLFIHCIRQSESKLVDMLLGSVEHKEKVAKEIDGLARSPLIHAVIMNNNDMVKKLSVCSDLGHQDLEGRSAAHYVVQPLKYGSYENTSLLDVLAAAGAPLDLRDSDDHTPMHLAAMQDTGVMAKALKRHGVDVRPDLRRMPTELHKFEAVDRFSIDEDSSAYLAASVVKENVEPIVDAHFEGRRTSKVYTNEQGVIFDVLLNKVDVTYGSYGLNNYYKLQVLHESVQNVYFVWTHWGRWGDGPGMFQRTPFNSAAEAVTEFQKIFRSKTGNDWSKVASGEFTAVPKKYKMLPVERVHHRVKELLAPFDLSKVPPSRLSPLLQETLRYLTDVSSLVERGRHEGVDRPEAALRFGQMSGELLSKARAVLDELAPLVKQVSDLRYQPQCDIDALLKLNDRMVELSNRYYEYLPQIHSCFRDGSNDVPIMVISQPHHLQAARQQLRRVTDFSVTARIILAAWHHHLTVNPLDYCYQALHTVVEPLAANSIERNVVEAYMLATGEASAFRYTVCNVFKVERRGEPQRMSQWKSMENHRLLWHGSPSPNLLSILSLGLLLTRAEPDMANNAELTSIWNGLYFADMFNKSINYAGTTHHGFGCRAPGAGTTKARLYVLLCEVALGKMLEVDRNTMFNLSTLPEGSDSLLLRGKEAPDWEQAITLANGVQIPLGGVARPGQRTVKHDTSSGTHSWAFYGCPYNEYIVGDESRVRMRYVIELLPK